MNALHLLLDLRRHLQLGTSRANCSHEEAVRVVHFDRARPFHSFDQDLDIAIRHLHALYDVANGPGGEDILCARLIDRCVMLSCKEDLSVARESLFQGPHARLATDDKRRHHVREDDHVPDRHHWKFLCAAA